MCGATSSLNSNCAGTGRGDPKSAVNISGSLGSSLAGEKLRLCGSCLGEANDDRVAGEAGGFDPRGLGSEAPQKRKNFAERRIVASFAFVDDPLHERQFEPFAILDEVVLYRVKRRGEAGNTWLFRPARWASAAKPSPRGLRAKAATRESGRPDNSAKAS